MAAAAKAHGERKSVYAQKNGAAESACLPSMPLFVKKKSIAAKSSAAKYLLETLKNAARNIRSYHSAYIAQAKNA